MFKKLKSQVQDAVNEKLTQLSSSQSLNPGQGEASGRSRANSHSSIASDTTSAIFGNYSTPQRRFYPPSDIESEFETEIPLNDSNHLPNQLVQSPSNSEVKKLNKLLDVYKNKFSQLKNAYSEVETEKEKIKKVLTDSQDKVLKRVQELKDQIESERQSRTESELKLKTQLAEKETVIYNLKTQANVTNQPVNLIDLETQQKQSSDEAVSNEKVERLELLLRRCRELIKTQKEQLADKEKLVEEQQEKIKDFEGFEAQKLALIEQNSVLQSNAEKLQKRCNDLNMELEEKGNLFQKQFQIFQIEFNEKEESLKNKLKSLQEDYFNLEKDYLNEKEKNKSTDELEDCKKNHENLVNDLKNEHENQLNNLNLLKDAEITKFKQEFESKLNEIKALEANCESLKNELVECNKDHENLVEKLRNEHENKLNELNILKDDQFAKLDNQIEISEKLRHEFGLNESENRDLKQQLQESQNELEKMKLIEQEKEIIKAELVNLKSNKTDSEKELLNTIETLKSELNDQQSSQDKLTNRIEELTKKVSILDTDNNKKISDLIQSNEKLKDFGKNLLDQIGALKSQLKCQTEEIENYKSKIDELNKINSDNEKQFSETNGSLNDEIKALLSNLKKTEEHIELKVKQNTDLIREINNLTETNQEHKTQIESLNDNLRSTEDKCNELNSSNEILNKKILDLNTELKEQFEKSHVDLSVSHKNELEFLNRQIIDLKSSNEVLLNKIQELEKCVSEIDELKTQKNKLAEEIANLRNKISEGENTKIELMSKLTEFEGLSSIKAELETRIKHFETEIQNYEAFKADTLKNEESKLNEIKVLGENCEKLKNKLKIHENLVKDLKNEHESKLNEFDAFKVGQEAKFNNEIGSLKQEFESKINSLNSEISQLRENKSDDENLLEKIDSLKLEVEESKNKLKLLQAGYVNLEKDYENKKSELETLNNLLESKITEINTLEANCKSLKNELVKCNKDHEIFVEKLKIEHENQLNEKNLLKDAEITKVKQEFESKIDTLNSQITDLREKNSDNEKNLLEQMDFLKLEVEESQKKLKLFQDDNMNLGNDLTNKKSELETLNNLLESKLTKNKVLEENCEHLKSELEDCKKNHENLVNDLKNEHESKLNEFGLLKDTEITKFKQEFESKINKLNSQITELRENKSDNEKNLLEQIDEFRNKLQIQQDENLTLETLRDKIVKNESEISDLKTQLEQSKHEFDVHHHKNNETKQQTDQHLSDLHKENESLKAMLQDHDSLKTELVNLKSNKTDSEKELSNTIESLKSELNDKESYFNEEKDKLKILETELESNHKIITDLKHLEKTLLDKIDLLQSQFKAQTEETEIYKTECQNYLQQINDLTETSNTSINEHREQLDLIKKQHKSELETLSKKFESDLKEKLENSQIDVNSLQEKLTESLKDYRASIDKLQQASKQRYLKIKKKLSNCSFVLNLIETSLFQLDNQSNSLFTEFINNLNQNETKKQDESNFEFDEEKFRVLIEMKQSEFKKLKDCEFLKCEIKTLKDELESTKLKFNEEKEKALNDHQQELDELQLKLANLDLKHKQLQLDENRELHSLKKKLVSLEEDLTKARKDTDELVQSVKQKAELRIASIKKQSENETSSKIEDLNNKVYDLELKLKEKNKQIEVLKSDSDSYGVKIEGFKQDLNSEKLRHKEELDNKCKYYETFMDEIRAKNKEFIDSERSEINRLKSQLEEVSSVSKSSNDLGVINKLRVENQDLSKQFEELKYAYDDLLDEKSQLSSSLSEMRQREQRFNNVNSSNDFNDVLKMGSLVKEKERVIGDLEAKLAAKQLQAQNNKQLYEDSLGFATSHGLRSPTYNSRSLMAESSDQESLGSRSNFFNNSMYMEATEIDYLRQIVYSYMMGVDPVTMAKVIVAVLKFPEDERRRLLENEKVKNSNWLPNLIKKQ